MCAATHTWASLTAIKVKLHLVKCGGWHQRGSIMVIIMQISLLQVQLLWEAFQLYYPCAASLSPE